LSRRPSIEKNDDDITDMKGLRVVNSSNQPQTEQHTSASTEESMANLQQNDADIDLILRLRP